MDDPFRLLKKRSSLKSLKAADRDCHCQDDVKSVVRSSVGLPGMKKKASKQLTTSREREHCTATEKFNSPPR